MRELVVGVGEGTVSSDPDAVLVTYALGSCIAVMVHDPVARVAGMIHYMLPESPRLKDGPGPQPWKFADTGIPHLLRVALASGADLRGLLIVAAGGAQVLNDNSIFNIGKRNCLALRKHLWKFGLVPHAEETGGTLVRTVRIEVNSGRVWLQSPGNEQREIKPRVGNRTLTTEVCPWR